MGGGGWCVKGRTIILNWFKGARTCARVTHAHTRVCAYGHPTPTALYTRPEAHATVRRVDILLVINCGPSSSRLFQHCGRCGPTKWLCSTLKIPIMTPRRRGARQERFARAFTPQSAERSTHPMSVRVCVCDDAQQSSSSTISRRSPCVLQDALGELLQIAAHKLECQFISMAVLSARERAHAHVCVRVRVCGSVSECGIRVVINPGAVASTFTRFSSGAWRGVFRAMYASLQCGQLVPARYFKYAKGESLCATRIHIRIYPYIP